MKKTKLLTSIAALALVLSLGACGDVTINVGDVDVDLGGDSSSDSTSSESSEDEDTSETGGDDETSGPSEEDKLAKDLAAFQETLEGLGTDPFSEWEAYQYKLDDETRLIRADESGYPYGYFRAASDEVSYFVDGQEFYSGYDGSYETYELTKTFEEQLKEDGAFLDLETLLALTSEDVLSLAQEEDTYTISYQFVEEGMLQSKTTYTYTLGLTIAESKLVKATCNYIEVYEAGSLGSDSEEEKSESIEKIDPDTITLDLLVEEGYNADLWIKEEGPVLLGTFDWTGFTDGDSSTATVTLPLTVSTLEDNLSRAWKPESAFTGHSYSVTSTSNMRPGSHNNVSNCDLVGSLECITFGNGRGTTGSMVLTFDEKVNIERVEVVDCLGSTTSNNLTVNGQAKAGYDYKNLSNWNDGAKWEDVPAVVYDDIEQGNTLSMSLTQSASADKVIVHSIAIYGTIGSASTTEPSEEEEESGLPNYTVAFSFAFTGKDGPEEYWTKTVFTEDALVTEYYTDYDELCGNGEYSYQDKEVFLNTEEGCDIFMCWDWYQEDLYYQETREGTYVDFFGASIFDLKPYESNFVEGETSTTSRGSETSYTINNLSDSDFTETLLRRLFDYYFKSYEICYEYDSSLEGFDQLLAAGENLDYSLVYIADVDTYEFIFSYSGYTYTAYLYDIGTSESTIDSLNLIYDYETD